MIYLVFVMCGIQSMLCAEFSLSYVWDLVCLMCGIASVSCEVFSLCYVQSLVCEGIAAATQCVACHAMRGPKGICKRGHPYHMPYAGL